MIHGDVKVMIAYGCRVEVLHQAMRMLMSVVAVETKVYRSWVSRSTGRPNCSAIPSGRMWSMEVDMTCTCNAGSTMTTGSSFSTDYVHNAVWRRIDASPGETLCTL